MRFPFQIFHLLMHTILLASRSPRRQQLMEAAGYRYRVDASDVEEHFPEGLDPAETAEHLAGMKAEASLGLRREGEWVLAADTIVAVDGERLAKPADAQEARAMLLQISGRTHSVCTGVALRYPDASGKMQERRFHESTEVEVAPLEHSEIEYYVREFRPFDKAGAYAIQEWIGLVGIPAIRGCYYNVMGLPMPRLYRELGDLGLKPLGTAGI
jgi:septum formation protein